jgi:hypothetical protein
MFGLHDLVGISATLLTTCALAMGADLHVDPTGNDANPGTADKPLQTFAAAVTAARPHAGKEPVKVLFHAGTYYLAAPIVFTAADSGTKAAPVSYLAAGDGEVVISGGRALTGLTWRDEAGGIKAADIPADLATDQVFVNGEALLMARYPNWQPFAPGVKFNGSAADAIAPERVARWADPTGGIIHAMHNAEWGDMSWTITGKDAQGHLTMEGGWQNNRPSKMHNTYRMVENIREELDAPGEWYLDRTAHRLLIIPPVGVDLAKARIETVRLKHLVEFQGSKAAPVTGITLRGLTFRHTARTFMENKEPLTRSDWTIYRGGAVFFNGAEDCAIEDAFIDQVGGNAVFVSGYNRRIAIRRTEIDRCGANATAFIGLAKAVRSPLFNYDQSLPLNKLDLTPGPQTDDYPADCVVDDCLLTRFAQTEKQSTGVEIQMAMHIVVRHSSIYDCPRAAINIGDGCWGGHLIEDNDVFDTVRETGDHGSFNAWGRDRYWVPNMREIDKRVSANPELPLLDCIKPIVLRHNRWRYDHNVGWDVDLDDGCSNYIIENNLCLNKGIKLREGFKRTVRNNICVNNGLHPHVWPEKSGDIVTGNIFFNPCRPIGMFGNAWFTAVDRNFFTSDKALADARATGAEAHGIAGDPQFLAPTRGDYRVADTSPALRVGFRNFSMDDFGVHTPRLKAKARNALQTTITSASTTAGVAKTITWQGATITSVTTIGQVSATGLSEAAGALFVEVPPGSAAASMGFATMDVVRAVAGKPVKTAEAFLTALPPKGTVTMTVRRNQVDVERTISLEIRR